jgi:hypothetical protein
MSPFFRQLRRDFLYVTVNANDYGLEGVRGLNFDVPPNILIISASGRGHIPVLLHFRPLDWVDPLPKNNSVLFLGRLKRGKRIRVVKRYERILKENITILKKVEDWVKAYREFSLILSPRGNARGCFRTAEILELGLIPIMAFEKKKWVPYLNSRLPWDDIAFHSVNSEVPALAEKINALTPERLKIMRKNVRKYKYTHWTLNATLDQIEMFLKSGYEVSDLRCGEFYSET